MDDYIDLLKDFEVKKKELLKVKRSKIMFRIPSAIVEIVKETTGQDLSACIQVSKYKDAATFAIDKIHVQEDTVGTFYQTAVKSIVSHLQKLFLTPELSGCSAILMIGGFSESGVLQDNIRSNFPHLQIIVPEDATVAVLKGSTVYGHDPRAVAHRVLKYTYGQKATHKFQRSCMEVHPGSLRERDENGVLRCTNLFSVHARVGDIVQLDQEHRERVYQPVSGTQTQITIPVLLSTELDPKLTDGSIRLGTLNIPIPNIRHGKDRKFGVSFMFGETEVKVKVVDKVTGRVETMSVDCLE